MKDDIRIIVLVTLGLIIFALLSTRAPSTKIKSPERGSWACVADAFICPDGTGVGRVPPYCQFAPCPGT